MNKDQSMYREIDGIHIISADFLTEDEAKILPDEIKIIRKPYWLKPEKEGHECPYVDECGNFKIAPTTSKCGRRIVVTVYEKFPQEKQYTRISLNDFDWYIISENQILMCTPDDMIDNGIWSNDLQKNLPGSNSFGWCGAKPWFKYHFGTLTHFDVNDDCVEIPAWVQSIPDGFFAGNEKIKSVIFPENLEYIGGHDSFRDCPNLEKIYFKHNDNTLITGSQIFTNCPKLKKVNFEDWSTFWNYKHDTGGAPLSNGADLLIAGKTVTSVVIPDDIDQYTGIRTLEGANIKDIRFADGSSITAISYKYNNILTKKKTLDELIAKYPSIINLITITEDIGLIIQNASRYGVIYDNITTLELGFLYDAYYEIYKLESSISRKLSEKVVKTDRYYLQNDLRRHFKKWCKLIEYHGEKYSDIEENNICSDISKALGIDFSVYELRSMVIDSLVESLN